MFITPQYNIGKPLSLHPGSSNSVVRQAKIPVDMEDLGGKRSAEGGRRETSRCPVQHSTSSTNSSREGEGSAEAVLSSVSQGSVNPSIGSSGFWSRIATYIPFRSNTNKTGASRKDNNGATGTASGNTITGSEGGCPVGTSSSLSSSPASPALDPSAHVESSSGCPVQHNPASPAKGGLAALLTGESGPGGAVGEGSEPAYNMMNNEYVYGQEEYPGQEMPLSILRQRSSIPKADYNPSHQPKEEVQTWVYPSEQQYYNAIKRKGYKASATDMPSTLAIHNAVNEKGWAMVKEWERERTAARTAGDHATMVEEEVADLRLLRFSGRPQDMSPKAWINTYLLGYRPPFDRHDWIVKRSDGTEARYVIDFYSGKAPPGSNIPVAMHLDVRPALDSFDAVFDRTRMYFMKEIRPYLSKVSDRFRNESRSSSSGSTSEEDTPPPAVR